MPVTSDGVVHEGIDGMPAPHLDHKVGLLTAGVRQHRFASALGVKSQYLVAGN